MLHVVLLELLRKLDPPSRQRLLELSMRWRHRAPQILAECLGLFAEADSGALRQVLVCLQELVTEEAWQVRYAVCKSLERVLKAPKELLNGLFEEGGHFLSEDLKIRYDKISLRSNQDSRLIN